MRRTRKFHRSLVFLLASVAGFFLTSLAQLPQVFAGDGANFVTIYDQGEKLIIKTDAETVAEVLERAGIVYSDSDTIEPALGSPINADNFFINLYRARPVLIIDGNVTKYTYASGYDARTIVARAGFAVYDGDDITAIMNPNFLETGIVSAYKITRNGGQILTIEEEIPFAEQIIRDYNIPVGTSELRQLGEVGSRTIVYRVQTQNGVEISRELVSEAITREPVARITAIGVSKVEMHPLTASMGRNRYTITLDDGTTIERQETYYDLNMSRVMQYRLGSCGDGTYSVREDGVKVDNEGYVLVAANLERYPFCTIVQTSLGEGRVYDTGTFAMTNPEQFDIATDWTNRNGV